MMMMMMIYTQSPNVTVEFETYLVRPGFTPQTKDGLFRGCSSFSSVCGGIRVGMNYQTHNTHARAQLCVHATLFLRVRTMSAAGRLLAAAPNRVAHIIRKIRS